MNEFPVAAISSWGSEIFECGRKTKKKDVKKLRVNRAMIAEKWLIQKFNEKTEYTSAEIFRAAHESGLGRSAVFEAKINMGDKIIVKRKGDGTGGSRWFWIANFTENKP